MNTKYASHLSQRAVECPVGVVTGLRTESNSTAAVNLNR